MPREKRNYRIIHVKWKTDKSIVENNEHYKTSK